MRKTEARKNLKRHSNARAPQPAQSDPRIRGDSLNSSIISLLEVDGRMPFSELAQTLKVSEGTIRNRVNIMKEAGLLRIMAIADPVASDYQTDAIIGIKVAAGCKPESVAARLGKQDAVVYILWVAGRYDLIVELVSDDSDGLLEFLNNEIHDSPDIAGVDVMYGLKNFKNQFLLKRDWTE